MGCTWLEVGSPSCSIVLLVTFFIERGSASAEISLIRAWEGIRSLAIQQSLTDGGDATTVPSSDVRSDDEAMRTNRRRATGSTLVEHMAATAITAILMTIAAPSYTEYVRRGWIVDGTNTLTTYAARLDSSFDSDGNYGVAA